MNSFAFSSGLHCDAVWTNRWWHFHTGLQLPALRCAGLCHRTFQLWWQNRLWITHKSSVVDSHLNQHATNPHSHQINPASLDSPTLPVIGVDNSNGSSNVTIPAVVLLLSVWVPPGVRHKMLSCYRLILHDMVQKNPLFFILSISLQSSELLGTTERHTIGSPVTGELCFREIIVHLIYEGVWRLLTSLKDVKPWIYFFALLCFDVLCCCIAPIFCVKCDCRNTKLQ